MQGAKQSALTGHKWVVLADWDQEFREAVAMENVERLVANELRGAVSRGESLLDGADREQRKL